MKESVVKPVIIAVSVIVTTVVAFLFYSKGVFSSSSVDVSMLPFFHAMLNSGVAILLVVAFWAIKNQRQVLHQRLMISAFTLSSVFLVSYVTYHSFSEPTQYGGEGILKSIYYVILFSHIVLAAIILPLVLLTFYYAVNRKHTKHKKLARWTLPLWLYVAITGVLVYILISPYYG